MAIDSYTALQSAVASWLGHGLFADRVPDFITMFEAAANRRLRVRQQETTATIAMSIGLGTLPTDYLQWRRFLSTNAGVSTVLQYVTPEYITAGNPTSDAGDPALFTIRGETIVVRPVNDSASHSLLYYAKIAALSDSATTNWLLTAHPDVYLFGSLAEAEAFGINDERMPIWLARREAVFNEIEQLSNKSRGVGGMRVMAQTP